MNSDRWIFVNAVNDWVNEHVKPVTDMRHWGVFDRWDYAEDGRGDCEDFALRKRQMLLNLGLPREALLMTVVWAGREGHAVLIVRTEDGDYVLDNKNKSILIWTKTGYDFVKRQSDTDQNAWVYIDGSPRIPAMVARIGSRKFASKKSVRLHGKSRSRIDFTARIRHRAPSIPRLWYS
jgi:predicted transglutaminase-like cysteine proteinase